jgi:hypothetical protein
MNEQIKQLAEQATIWEGMEDGYIFDKEKFALLIVKECLKLNSKELSITAIERLLPLYKEHFGVEE